MDWVQFQSWAFPSAIGALAIVIYAVGRSIMARMDRLEHAVNRDMRFYGERIMRVETHLQLPPIPITVRDD